MQIQRNALPDTILVRELDTSTEYDGEYLAPYEIKHVRFEKSEALNRNAYQLCEGAKGRIFIDAVNSEGAKAIPVGAKVSINNTANMSVLACTELRTFNKIHHWEVDVG